MTDRPRALITGGAKRVGRATALSLARAGCDCLLTYRTSEDEARQTADDLRDLDRSADLLRLDLDDPGSIDRLAESVLASGRLDILVHNASIYHPTPLEELTLDAAERLMRINALAPLLLTARLAPLLRASSMPGGGSVVCMADIHAMGRPRTDFAAYSMSKAALVEMVRSLARDLAPRVRINAVAPGVVAWPEEGHESDEESQRAYLKRVPLARPGAPEDAAEAVRWLALDATYTTGQVIRIDGGRFLA